DERPAADSILRTSRRRVEPHTRSEQRELDDDRRRHRVPQSKPEAGASRIERHVGAVRNEVEDPVADDERRQQQENATLASETTVSEGKNDAPHYQEEQRMRVRIADEVERRYPRD